MLEKEHDYRDEHFDFIQSHVRRFSLQCILSIVPRLLSAQNQPSPVLGQRRVIVRVAATLTSASRRRRPHLYLSEGGEESGSALQVHSTQGVRLSVRHVGLSGGEGRSVHVSGVDVTQLVGL